MGKPEEATIFWAHDSKQWHAALESAGRPWLNAGLFGLTEAVAKEPDRPGTLAQCTWEARWDGAV